MESSRIVKRSRSSSPSSRQRRSKGSRRNLNSGGLHGNDGLNVRKEQESFAREQTRRNQVQEDVQMREWVSKEDEFVLKQSKKKAQIRVREGRAKPIDRLAVILTIVGPKEEDLLEEVSEEPELDIMDPESVIDELGKDELQALEKDIETYLVLETKRDNRIYWNAMKILNRDMLSRMALGSSTGRAVSSVSADIDKLLGPKSLEQLVVLETQVNNKLRSDEPIDEEYWEQLLGNIGVYKARAQLRGIYRSIIESRFQNLKEQQILEAHRFQENHTAITDVSGALGTTLPPVIYSQKLDPEPALKLLNEDKILQLLEEAEFISKVEADRQRVQNMAFVPIRRRIQEKQMLASVPKPINQVAALPGARFASSAGEDFSQATKALYEREVARGVQDDEEIFAGEEEVSTALKSQWAGKYRPRKPRYFNRVQMGYEWNKYNQTHYDHDNPPPKVVQGYKFNIFYPDLIDSAKAPTYRIERENGRKRGQTFAPAGEEDTCLIRFMSGPPYEDIAFRVVDKEWDYSAKRERGFRSSFDKGILQLHFHFKKVYYRK